MEERTEEGPGGENAFFMRKKVPSMGDYQQGAKKKKNKC